MASTTRTLVIIGAAAVAVGALPGCSDEPFDDPLQRARYASLDACQADWGDTQCEPGEAQAGLGTIDEPSGSTSSSTSSGYRGGSGSTLFWGPWYTQSGRIYARDGSWRDDPGMAARVASRGNAVAITPAAGARVPTPIAAAHQNYLASARAAGRTSASSGIRRSGFGLSGSSSSG
ncbi:MAG TPA: hypothetical protein PLP74_05950 [Quisquiliibacterium sp.]|nr:MAG: DUF1190 domain-containing protein [Burkholderiaceae bacterium]HOA92321.1 hypothetical protein [Quisquiliibacterium sp.]HPA89208.1 hypothetical protein [Quisquiliibacterium sp.]HQD81706.1 hypothetical protein [Quisquiliibacterium sp.]HQN11647.1 hypothetical protein [Quisquiliibacterium sp.]